MTKPQNQVNKPNLNKIPKGLWQITLPLMTVIIFGLGCITTIYMTNGQYWFEIDMNRDGIKLQTNMDKTNKRDRSSEVDGENSLTPNNQSDGDSPCSETSDEDSGSVCEETSNFAK